MVVYSRSDSLLRVRAPFSRSMRVSSARTTRAMVCASMPGGGMNVHLVVVVAVVGRRSPAADWRSIIDGQGRHRGGAECQGSGSGEMFAQVCDGIEWAF